MQYTIVILGLLLLFTACNSNMEAPTVLELPANEATAAAPVALPTSIAIEPIEIALNDAPDVTQLPTETLAPVPTATKTLLPQATATDPQIEMLTATTMPVAQPTAPVILATVAPSPTPSPVNGLKNLDQFLWQNRLIVVFVDSAEVGNIEAQFWNENLAVVDRHILWFIVADDQVTSNYTGALSTVLADNLRAKYRQLASSLELVLVGKDGGVKNRQAVLDSNAIYWQIDQMPMRQAEMEQQDR